MSKKSESKRMPRRAVLKSALMVLGASVVVQPSGAVFGLAQQAPTKDTKIKADAKVKGSAIKGESTTHIKGQSTTPIKGETNQAVQGRKTNKVPAKDQHTIKYGGQQ